MAFDLDHALRYLIAAEGSDLHLKVPSYPLIRLHGHLEPIAGTERLFPEDTRQALQQMLADPEKVAEFEAENEVDFSYSVEGLGRFRVNAFLQRGSISIVMRAIPVTIKSVDELGLPEAVTKLANEERGIILLTGTTGSGKSTTLAAMIDHMNRTMQKHIVTIEDPIEFLHRDRNCIINQREVGQDTASFKRALRRVLRQDPDVILVGEMRDEETVHTALSAAETGHLVLSTLHTVDAPETVNRIIDFFPPHQQQQARAMIAGTLKGIVSQRLVKTADGHGRVACCEIMVMTGRVHDMILDPKLTGQLPEVVAEGGYYGMQTFDQHLLKHLQAGRITYEEAMRAATSPHDFKLMVAAERPDRRSLDAQPSPSRRCRRRIAPATVGRAAGPSAPPPGVPFVRLTRLDASGRGSRGLRPMQTTLGQFNETQSQDAFALQNSKLLKVRLEPVTVQAKLGSMVAYQGDVTFEHAGSGGLGRMLKKAVTGEGTQLMKVTGSGEVFLADQAQDIHLIYLENDMITVNGPNLLAFDTGIDWDIRRVEGASSMMGGGLYNMALHGTGWVAILSDGPPVLLNVAAAPTFADAQAAITWSSGVSTGIRTDFKMKNLIGRGSGETVQMSFQGQGWVLVQPSEGRIVPVAQNSSGGGGLGSLLNG